MPLAPKPIANPPVRIFALGGFLVKTPRAPQGVRTRTRSKPLELLKLVVAHGGEGVPVQQVVDILWPDADGERAQWAFTATLRRLRGLVHPHAVQVHNAQVALCEEHCWLDARRFADALRESAAAMDAGQATQAAGVLHEALLLYQGPLLAGESDAPLVLAARERLHGALLRHVQRLGGLLQKAGDDETAVALYRRALEAGPGVEWLYQELMRCLGRAGRHSEGIAVYEGCRRNLRAHLEADPAPQTEALRQVLSPPPGAPEAEPPSLYVRPFEAQPDEDGYFASGFTYDVTSALHKISGLAVYRSLGVEGGEEWLGPSAWRAQYVLGGAVRRMESRVRVTLNLIETARGKQIWSERYDREAERLYAVLDEIVEEIVTSLRVTLVEGEQARIWSRSLRSPLAREQFYLGLEHIWRMAPEQMVLARERFREVMDLEPQSTIGYGYTAWTHLFDVLNGWSSEPRASQALAAEYCNRALAVDVDGLSLHSVLGHLHLIAGESQEALARAETAIRLRPGCGLAQAFLANILLHLGRPREAIAHIQMAFRLSPLCPPWYLEVLGWSYLVGGFYEQAAAAARHALRREQHRPDPHLILAAALHAQGRAEEARACFAAFTIQQPEFDLAAFMASKPCQGPELLAPVLACLGAPRPVPARRLAR
jgi:TolB-like protein